MGINRAIGSIEQVGDGYIIERWGSVFVDEGVSDTPPFQGGKALAHDFDELVSVLRTHFNAPAEEKQLTMLDEIGEELGGENVFSLELGD